MRPVSLSQLLMRNHHFREARFCRYLCQTLFAVYCCSKTWRIVVGHFCFPAVK